MRRILLVISVFIWSFASTATFPRAIHDLGSNRTRRHAVCKDSEYPNSNICCLNCPAGTHLTSACTTPGEKGQCDECDDESYAEHENHLSRCVTCTTCRSDQEVVRPCSRTQNRECRCTEGRFCLPEQACEMCRICSRCEKDEEVVRNCTATSNTVCKKILSQSDSTSVSSPIVILAVFAGIVICIVFGLIYWCWHKKKLAAGLVGNELKAEHILEGKNEQTPSPGCSSLIFSQPRVRVQSSATMEEECQALCESHNSSASNSQQNLTSLPSAFLAFDPRAYPTASQPDLRMDEPFPELLPVNGEESLRKCFQYFEDVNIDYYNRFFRQLGLNPNVIKSKDQLLYEDRIHELLNIWFEKEGKGARLNDLLEALLKFDQRRTAELIKEKALENGHYILETK